MANSLLMEILLRSRRALTTASLRDCVGCNGLGSQNATMAVMIDAKVPTSPKVNMQTVQMINAVIDITNARNTRGATFIKVRSQHINT